LQKKPFEELFNWKFWYLFLRNKISFKVIKTDQTSEQTHKTLLEFGKLIGKTTVECKDVEGFIVNRLLIPYNCEAVRMYERGDASFQGIYSKKNEVSPYNLNFNHFF